MHRLWFFLGGILTGVPNLFGTVAYTTYNWFIIKHYRACKGWRP